MYDPNHVEAHNYMPSTGGAANTPVRLKLHLPLLFFWYLLSVNHVTSVSGDTSSLLSSSEEELLAECASLLLSSMKLSCSALDTQNSTAQSLQRARLDGLLIRPNCTGCTNDTQASQPLRALMVNHQATNADNNEVVPKLTNLYGRLAQIPYNTTEVEPDWWATQMAIPSPTLLDLLDTYAAWALAPSALPVLYENGMLQQLSKLVDSSSQLSAYWQDIPQVFRDAAALYDSKIVGVPYTAEVPLLSYRRDLFPQYNLTVPATWEEALAIAKIVNGTKVPCMSDESQTCEMHGFCLGFPGGCFYDGLALATIWASMVATSGTKGGLYFDPVTMQPMFTGPAMVEALRIYRELSALSPRDVDSATCTRPNITVLVQGCFMGLSLTNAHKAAGFAFGGKAATRLRVTMLPGSPVVQNRRSGALENCTADLCPYATNVTSAVLGGTVLVNRVPYLGRGALSLAINRHADPAHALASLRAFTFALTWKDGWPFALDPASFTMSVRSSHLSLGNLPMWVAAGYDEQYTANLLSVVAESLSCPGLAVGPRALGAVTVESAFGNAATLAVGGGSGSGSTHAGVNASGDPSALAIDLLNETYQYLLSHHYNGDPNLLRIAYWRDIGYQPPSPPGSASAPSDSSDVDSTAGTTSTHAGLPTGATLALGVGGASLVVLVVWVVAVVKCQKLQLQRWNLKRRPVAAPGYSPDTSLCITDIQSSTQLWEELDPVVMDSALSLHNATVRSLLPKHLGYECHTEGDSFIIAFHSAAGAVAFALEMQVAMLQLPWPEDVVNHAACAAVPNSAALLCAGGGGHPATSTTGAAGGGGAGPGGAAGGGAPALLSSPTGGGGGGGIRLSGHAAPYMHPLVLLTQVHLHSPMFYGSFRHSDPHDLKNLYQQQHQQQHQQQQRALSQTTIDDPEPSNASRAANSRTPATLTPALTPQTTINPNSPSGNIFERVTSALAAAASGSFGRHPPLPHPATPRTALAVSVTTAAAAGAAAGVPPRSLLASPTPSVTTHRREPSAQLLMLPLRAAGSGSSHCGSGAAARLQQQHPQQPQQLLQFTLTQQLSRALLQTSSPQTSLTTQRTTGLGTTGLGSLLPISGAQARRVAPLVPASSLAEVAGVAAAAAASGAATAAESVPVGTAGGGCGCPADVESSAASALPSSSAPAAASGLSSSLLAAGGPENAPSGGSGGSSGLAFRGFRVRVGICSGLEPGRDVVYQKGVSHRTAYSGACMQLTKLISDAAHGGMVLLGASTVERLMPLPRKDMPGLVVWHKGRFILVDKDTSAFADTGAGTTTAAKPRPYACRPPSLLLSPPPPAAATTRTTSLASPAAPSTVSPISTSGYNSHSLLTSTAQTVNVNTAAVGPTADSCYDLYQAMAGSMLHRQLLLERLPLRTQGQVLPGVLSAPLGCLVLAMVQAVGLTLLLEWNEAVTREAVGLLHATALEHLRAAGGYPAVMEGGQILAAFTSAPAAVRWLLALEEDLRCSVPWPEELLEHELADELTLALPTSLTPATSMKRLSTAQRWGIANGNGCSPSLESTGGGGGGSGGGAAAMLSPTLGTTRQHHSRPNSRGREQFQWLHTATSHGFRSTSARRYQAAAPATAAASVSRPNSSKGFAYAPQAKVRQGDVAERPVGSLRDGSAATPGGAAAAVSAAAAPKTDGLSSDVLCDSVRPLPAAPAAVTVTGATAGGGGGDGGSGGEAAGLITTALAQLHRLGNGRQRVAPSFKKRSVSYSGALPYVPLSMPLLTPQMVDDLQLPIKEGDTCSTDRGSSRSNLTSPGRQALVDCSQTDSKGSTAKAVTAPPSSLEPESGPLPLPLGRSPVPPSKSLVHYSPAAPPPPSAGVSSSFSLVPPTIMSGISAAVGTGAGSSGGSIRAVEFADIGDAEADAGGDDFGGSGVIVQEEDDSGVLETAGHSNNPSLGPQPSSGSVRAPCSLCPNSFGGYAVTNSAPLALQGFSDQQKRPSALRLTSGRMQGGEQLVPGPTRASATVSATGAAQACFEGPLASSPASQQELTLAMGSFSIIPGASNAGTGSMTAARRMNRPRAATTSLLNALGQSLRPGLGQGQVRGPSSIGQGLASAKSTGGMLVDPEGCDGTGNSGDIAISGTAAAVPRPEHKHQDHRQQQQQQQPKRQSAASQAGLLGLPPCSPLRRPASVNSAMALRAQQQQLQQQHSRQHLFRSPFREPHAQQNVLHHRVVQQLQQNHVYVNNPNQPARPKQLLLLQDADAAPSSSSLSDSPSTRLLRLNPDLNLNSQQQQQRILRGLRVRCAVEEGNFFQNGSVSAARLYRHQHGGKTFARLSKLCAGAVMGQVVCSWAMAKKIRKAAVAGDSAAQQLRLSPQSPGGAATAAVGVGSGVLKHAVGGDSGEGDVLVSTTEIAGAGAGGTWGVAEGEESISDGRPSRAVPGGEALGKAQVWVCSWSREAMAERARQRAASAHVLAAAGESAFPASGEPGLAGA